MAQVLEFKPRSTAKNLNTDYLDLSEIAKTLGINWQIKISFDFLSSFIYRNRDKDNFTGKLAELIYLAAFQTEQGQTSFIDQISTKTQLFK